MFFECRRVHYNKKYLLFHTAVKDTLIYTYESDSMPQNTLQLNLVLTSAAHTILF